MYQLEGDMTFNSAEKLHKRLRLYAEKVLAGGQEVDDGYKLIYGEVPLGVYQHHEPTEVGPRQYLLTNVEVNARGYIEMVYVQLYAHGEHEFGHEWRRPLVFTPLALDEEGQVDKGFVQPVPISTEHPVGCQRFKLIRACTRNELKVVIDEYMGKLVA